ncbi:MAG: hypothetical protein QME12_06035 [Nanoarchaeota archaeon]|nr:hypothetical protein [Nanoarchaeota archaeon]
MNKLSINKRGSYDISRKTLYFILVLVVLAFIFIYMAGTIQKYYGIAMENRDAVFAQIMASEARFSTRCFAYYDESTGRIYPGFADMGKISQPWSELKKSCMKYADVPYAMKFEETQGGSSHMFSSGTLEESTEKTKRFSIAVKEGVVQEQPGRWIMEFNDYYILSGQKEPRTGEQMAREGRESIEESLRGMPVGV